MIYGQPSCACVRARVCMLGLCGRVREEVVKNHIALLMQYLFMKLKF